MRPRYVYVSKATARGVQTQNSINMLFILLFPFYKTHFTQQAIKVPGALSAQRLSELKRVTALWEIIAKD